MLKPTGKAIKEKPETTKEVVNDITKGSNSTKKKNGKYRVSLVFDGYLEDEIREAAARNGMPVATFIKWSVMQQLSIK